MAVDNGLHKNSTGANVHTPITWEYADAATRAAATGFASDDVGKFARQLDNNSIWVLTDDSPVTWVAVGVFASDLATGTPVSGDLVVYEHAGVRMAADIDDLPGGGGAGSALVLLEQHAASSSAALDFTSGISSTYDDYLIELVNIIPATDTANFLLTFSSDGGSNWIASNYNWSYNYLKIGATTTGTVNGASDSSIHLANANSNTGSQGSIAGHINLINPLSSALYKEMDFRLHQQNSGDSGIYRYDGGAYYAATTAINALRFAFSSGNIASGTIRIYGLAK